MITLRVSDDEKERLRQRASEKGLTLSDYVRTLLKLKSKSKRKKATCDLKVVAYELNKIGVNINQIARYVNINREIDLKVLNELSKVEDRLKEILSFSLKVDPQSK